MMKEWTIPSEEKAKRYILGLSKTQKALFLLTKRCHLYCRYCFRRTHNGTEDPSQSELREAIDIINTRKYEEVILSGGDPLAVRDDILEWVLNELNSNYPYTYQSADHRSIICDRTKKSRSSKASFIVDDCALQSS